MAQVTQGVCRDILAGQGYTDNEVKQLAHFWLQAHAAPSRDAQAAPAVPHRSTGYVAPKGRYVPPVLFNPYTGEPRDARDIKTDPQGVLIVPPGATLAAAAIGAPSPSPQGGE